MDFNKWIKEGVPYINKKQKFDLEKRLMEELSTEYRTFNAEWEQE